MTDICTQIHTVEQNLISMRDKALEDFNATGNDVLRGKAIAYDIAAQYIRDLLAHNRE